VVLPAAYVAEHVELGYALTIHRAQGLTVDEAHLVLGPGATREQLYVGMTRGRQANHAWTTTTGGPGAHHEHDPGTRGATPDQVLRAALATSGVQPSATEQLAATARWQAATHVTAAAASRPVPATRDPRHLTR
jgi:ATP-dependent exoDNAse (exonuclease V) alpha subunit